MRASYRQEQGSRETDTQRKKQKPETVRNPAPVLAVLALSGRRKSTATDIATTPASRGPCMATFHEGRLPRRASAWAAATASFAPLQSRAGSQSDNELPTVSQKACDSSSENASSSESSISFTNIQPNKICRHIICRTYPIYMFGKT